MRPADDVSRENRFTSGTKQRKPGANIPAGREKLTAPSVAEDYQVWQRVIGMRFCSLRKFAA
jgi:hypothetical protein